MAKAESVLVLLIPSLKAGVIEYANAPPVAVAPLSGMPLCGIIHN